MFEDHTCMQKSHSFTYPAFKPVCTKLSVCLTYLLRFLMLCVCMFHSDKISDTHTHTHTCMLNHSKNVTLWLNLSPLIIYHQRWIKPHRSAEDTNYHPANLLTSNQPDWNSHRSAQQGSSLLSNSHHCAHQGVAQMNHTFWFEQESLRQNSFHYL